MRRSLPRGAVAGVLALPFLIGIAALRGLTVALPIFHSDDEFNYHLPTIRQFAHQLPLPDLGHYRAAQTPLFHLVMALASKVVGLELWRLRLLEVLISYALALAVYRLLRRRLDQPQPVALGLALLFTLSPYVLGSAFRVITDNLATLFIVLALDRCQAFSAQRRLRAFALACVWVAGATLTRQSSAFMFAVLGIYALRVPRTPGGRFAALALVAASVLPALVLFAVWGGIVPPGGDPSSCGLCTSGAGGAGLSMGTPELTLATLGLYGAVLFLPPAVLSIRAGGTVRDAVGGRLAPVLAGAGTGALLLLVFPDRPAADAAGLIAAVARHFPVVLGSSLLLWALIPAAGASVVWRARVAPAPELIIVFTAAFLAGALATRYPWQKYVDPFALLMLVISAVPAELRPLRAWAGALVLAVGFVAYAADPALHKDVPAPRAQAVARPRAVGREPGPERTTGATVGRRARGLQLAVGGAV